MEKVSSKLVAITIILIFIIITVATIVKVEKNHIDNEYLVIEKKIKETCRDCYLDGICSGEQITLADLIRNGYIDNPIDPVSKEYISESTIITYNQKSCSVTLR